MDVVFLLGNGFDINIGMKTRYCDFYDYYFKQISLNDIIKTFKNLFESYRIFYYYKKNLKTIKINS